MSFIKKNMWVIGFVVIILGAFGTMALASRHTTLPSGYAVAQDTVNFTITDQDHAEGPANAKATLIEFADFQCPACGAYFPFLERLHTDFPNDLRIVYRYFPLRQIHFQAQNAAQVAEAAGLQGKFWEMYTELYTNQQKWVNSAGKSAFDEYAKNIGLNMDQYNADVDSRKVKDRIDLDLKNGNDIGINGTPTFYLNGKKMENPQSYEAFKAEITKVVGGTGSSSPEQATSTVQSAS